MSLFFSSSEASSRQKAGKRSIKIIVFVAFLKSEQSVCSCSYVKWIKEDFTCFFFHVQLKRSFINPIRLQIFKVVIIHLVFSVNTADVTVTLRFPFRYSPQ